MSSRPIREVIRNQSLLHAAKTMCVTEAVGLMKKNKARRVGRALGCERAPDRDAGLAGAIGLAYCLRTKPPGACGSWIAIFISC